MTDRWFSDIAASSDDGRYRLEAQSTSRREGPFQTDFVYTLDEVDGRSTRPIWRKAQLAQDQPIAVFVSNNGWVVVRTRGEDLIAVGTDGRVGEPLPLLAPGRIEEPHVSFTTAGPRWEAAHWGFRDFGGRHYFVLSTRWGRHVALDLEAGTEARPGTHAELHACLREEHGTHVERAERWSRYSDTLNAAVADLPQNAEAVLEATIAALDQRQTNALMWLRRIEADERGVTYETPDGLSATVYPLRQLARIGLRRLKQETMLGRPTCVVHQLPAAAASWEGNQRGFGASCIEVGMSVRAVLATAGPPERFRTTRGAQTMEWDVEHDAPFTVVVSFRRPDWTVAATSVIPPRWEGEWRTASLLRLACAVLRGEKATVDADADDVPVS